MFKAAMGAALALLISSCSLGSTRFISRMTFVNDTEYTVDISATGAKRDGWTDVGIARTHSSATVEQIVDQGPVWVFRFRSQGRAAGELRTTKDELVRARWRLVIPADVGDRLRADGAAPSP